MMMNEVSVGKRICLIGAVMAQAAWFCAMRRVGGFYQKRWPLLPCDGSVATGGGPLSDHKSDICPAVKSKLKNGYPMAHIYKPLVFT